MVTPSLNNFDFDKDELAPREIVKQARVPLEWDYWIYRIVVATLGLAVLASIGGAIFLSAVTKDIPEVLVAIGSAAVGALAGLIAPPPSSGGK
jgi:hypothetical protein